MLISKNAYVVVKTNFALILVLLFIFSCAETEKENPIKTSTQNKVSNQAIVTNQNTTFPQIHTNLKGMVREFVRTMHQDKNGNFWFGTNGDGIIRYDGNQLEQIKIEGISPRIRVLQIEEDKAGNVWFATSSGLIKYDGNTFTAFSDQKGLEGDLEIWSLTIDTSGHIWIGTTNGVSHFNGKIFTSFSLPKSNVENPQPIYSKNRVSGFLEDNDGNMWISNDGNGIFKYKNGNFTQLTTENGLTDNNANAGLLDKNGNIWISSYYGGTSKFNGTTFTNFTKNGIIEGVETANLIQDSKGNIWFTAENVGVYKYDGSTFTLYTTQNGLTSNVVLSIFEDDKGQLWFGSWQGLCIFDGEKFVDAKNLAPWTSFP